jgi:hypothetical protein
VRDISADASRNASVRGESVEAVSVVIPAYD